MKAHSRVKLLLFLFSICIGSHAHAEQFTKRFDEVVSNTYNGVKVAPLVKKIIEPKPSFVELVYEPGRKYDWNFIKHKICSPDLPASHKLQFIQDAIDNSDPSVPTLGYAYHCEAVKTQPDLERVYRSAYKTLAASATDLYTQYAYLNFVAIHNLADQYDLMEEYFASRATRSVHWRDEYLYPLYLSNNGRVTEAIGLSELIVKDIELGKSEYIPEGVGGSQSALFISMYFSSNRAQRKQVLDLAFRYFDSVSKVGYTTHLQKFLHFMAPERYRQSIAERLARYEADRSPEGDRPYIQLLRNEGSIALAPTMGYEYFKKYADSKPRWEANDTDFDYYMFDVARQSMSGIDNDNERAKVINYVLTENIHLQPQSMRPSSYNVRQFIELLKMGKPDLQVQDVARVLPDSYANHESWQKVISNLETWGVKDDDSYRNRKRMPYKKVMKLFEQNGFIENSSISEFDAYIHRNGCTEACGLFARAGIKAHFDTEGCVGPYAYVGLFNDAIRDILEKRDLGFISVTETENSGLVDCVYDISVSNKTKTFSTNFESCSDWYQTNPFIALINFALKDSGASERLVFLDTGDQTTALVLSNPDKIVPLIKSLGIRGFAIHVNSGGDFY